MTSDMRPNRRRSPAFIGYALAVVLVGLAGFALVYAAMRYPSRPIPKPTEAQNDARWKCVLSPIIISGGESIDITITTPVSVLPEEIRVSSPDGRWSEVLYDNTPALPVSVHEETRTRTGDGVYESETTSTIPSQVLDFTLTPPSTPARWGRCGFTLTVEYQEAQSGDRISGRFDAYELVWSDKTVVWEFPGPEVVPMDKFLLWKLIIGIAPVVAVLIFVLCRKDSLMTIILPLPLLIGCFAALFYADDANRAAVMILNRPTGIVAALQLTLIGAMAAFIPYLAISFVIAFVRPIGGGDRSKPVGTGPQPHEPR